MPKISVIIPVYKVEKYLHKCVDSILRQTLKDFEIILVDDGSPDKCPSICDELGKVNSCIKVIHKKNGGLSSARNAGLSVAKGKYVCFIDSDDYVRDTYLETLCHILDSDISLLIVSCPLIKVENGIESPFLLCEDRYICTATLNLKDYIYLIAKGQIDNSVANKLFRREFIKSLFLEGRNNEDILFLYYNCKLWGESRYISFCNDVSYYYIIRKDSICTTNTGEGKPFKIHIYKNIKEIYTDCLSWDDKIAKSFFTIYIRDLMIAYKEILKFPHVGKGDPLLLETMKTEIRKIHMYSLLNQPYYIKRDYIMNKYLNKIWRDYILKLSN